MMKKTNCIQKITNRKERASAPALYPKKASASCLFIHRTRALFTASLLLTAMLALPQCADTKGFLTDEEDALPCPTCPIYLWISTVNYQGGGFGGVSGADTECQTDMTAHAMLPATDPRLPVGEERIYNHRAVIVDSSSELPSEFNIFNRGGREVQRPDGTKIADNYNALFVGV